MSETRKAVGDATRNRNRDKTDKSETQDEETEKAGRLQKPEAIKYSLLQYASEIGKIAADLQRISKEVESDLQDDWPQGEDKSVTSYRIQACIANAQNLRTGLHQISDFAKSSGLSGGSSSKLLDPEAYVGHELLPAKTKKRLLSTLRSGEICHDEIAQLSSATRSVVSPAVIDLTAEGYSSGALKSSNHRHGLFEGKKSRKHELSTTASEASPPAECPNIEPRDIKEEEGLDTVIPGPSRKDQSPVKSSDSSKNIDDQFNEFYSERKKKKSGEKEPIGEELSPGILKVSSVEISRTSSESKAEPKAADDEPKIGPTSPASSGPANSAEPHDQVKDSNDEANLQGTISTPKSEVESSTSSSDSSENSENERKQSGKRLKKETGSNKNGSDEKESTKPQKIKSNKIVESSDEDMDENDKKLIAAAKSSKFNLDSDSDRKEGSSQDYDSTSTEQDDNEPSKKASGAKKPKGKTIPSSKKAPDTVDMEEDYTELASSLEEEPKSPPEIPENDPLVRDPLAVEGDIDADDLPADLEMSDPSDRGGEETPEPKKKRAKKDKTAGPKDENSEINDHGDDRMGSNNPTDEKEEVSSDDSDSAKIENQLNRKPARIDSSSDADEEAKGKGKAEKKLNAIKKETDEIKKAPKKRKRIQASNSSSSSSSDAEVSSDGRKGPKDEDGSDSIQELDSEGEAIASKPKKPKASRTKKSEKKKLSSDDEKPKKTKGRKKRVKVAESTEDSDVQISEFTDSDETSTPSGKKKSKTGKTGFVRKIMGDEKLSKETIDAGKAEKERRKRLEQKQNEFNGLISFNEDVSAEVDDDEIPGTSGGTLEAGIELTSKGPAFKKVILDREKDSGKVLVEIDPLLVKHLKKHQGEGIKFLFDATIESVSRFIRGDPGGGAILGHCMGLGKTFQVITYLQTVLMNEELSKDTQDQKGNVIQKGLKTALILAPINALLTWKTEHQKWIEANDLDVRLEVCNQKNPVHRSEVLQCWHEQGGIMVMGYERFRMDTEVNKKTKPKLRKIFQEALLDPGPDIIVCDEGHKLKNEKSKISLAVGKMSTKRRICLTGTPLQNNLDEYYVMIHFIKSGLLGTKKEFANRFANPIKQGQYIDSTPREVSIMRRRSFVLHNMLDSVVQRRDYLVLKPYLPQRKEYVVTVRLCERQAELYQHYITNAMRDADGQSLQRRMLSDYHILFRIWTHAYLLIKHQIEVEAKQAKEEEEAFVTEGSTTPSTVDSDISIIESDDEKPKGSKKKKASSDDENHDDFVKRASATIQKGTRSRRKDGTESKTTPDPGGDGSGGRETPTAIRGWWNVPDSEPLVKDEDQYKVELSGKLVLLFEIMKKCEEVGDKLLVFSQSLESLNIIEDFLEYFHDTGEWWKDGHTAVNAITSKVKWGWKNTKDYLRLDGSVPADKRKEMQDRFNAPRNHQCRLFLISTRAGSLGVDLIGANRCIIFDACWNPSHDTQSLFRVYRFGQIKPVFIYRFIAAGTMEEVIYNRQVTKLSLGLRVCDDKQIQRHFLENSLSELYKFTPHTLSAEEMASSQPTFLPPKDDRLLGDVTRDNKNWVVDIREHDSLLEHQSHEKLSEDQKKEAWDEYETEKTGSGFGRGAGNTGLGQAHAIQQQQIKMQQLALQFKGQEIELAQMGLSWQSFVDENLPFGRWIRQMETIYTGNNMVKAEILLVFGSFRALGHESLSKLERENKTLFERIMAGRDNKTFDQLVQEMFIEYMAKGKTVDILELQQNIVKLLAKLIGFLNLQNDISGREMTESEVMQVIHARCNMWQPPLVPGSVSSNHPAQDYGSRSSLSSAMPSPRMTFPKGIHPSQPSKSAAPNSMGSFNAASRFRESSSTFKPVTESLQRPSINNSSGTDFLSRLQAQKPEKVTIRASELPK